MIELRFVTSSDIVSRAIRFAEYGFWASHVDSVLPDGRMLGAHFIGGVQARPAGYDAGDRTREQIVRIKCDDEVADHYHEFLMAQVGKPYDALAIGAIVARRNWERSGSWFCSELVAAGLIECGYFHPLVANASKIMPRDLLLILSGQMDVPLVQVAMSGKITAMTALPVSGLEAALSEVVA